MAARRMLSRDIIEQDVFLDMPISAQCAYFHFVLNADDDGFVAAPKRLMRSIGAHDDDMKILAAKQYIIPFATGVIVIRHWLLHNTIRKDRYHATLCVAEKKQLNIENDTGIYVLNNNDGQKENQRLPDGCQTVVVTAATETRLDKTRLDKTRLGKTSDDCVLSKTQEMMMKNGVSRAQAIMITERYTNERIKDNMQYVAENDHGRWKNKPGMIISAITDDYAARDRHVSSVELHNAAQAAKEAMRRLTDNG